ncbi:RluA family pseudouridine synthase [Pseudonocardia spinosispora]|uniref:RluA family pseudouridine synthase n=1 Tax=Pseudonocardia spinosispora TaxID=103441 RepID=UPI00040D3E34|nr:RNA pseudouridine synthase [Pseudonocardia spinosispora]
MSGGPAPDWAALRRVLAETDEYLVLDKPAGISVTGERHDTDLVRIARDAGEELIPVHRIDKVTSGVVLLARTKAAHGPLTRQFAKRTVDKSYLVITRSTGLPTEATVELPLGVGRKNRVRVAAPREDIAFDTVASQWSVPESSVSEPSYPSSTAIGRLWEGSAHSLLRARPHTGRRHQIRVHLAWIGHPIAGDPLFPVRAGEPADGAVRTCLHAWRLAFDDASGRRVEAEASPDEDFWAPIAAELPPDTRTRLLHREPVC